MIEVRGLQKSFGPIPAVSGVSFEIRCGETFGLLGPNGAGKSSTIGMLTGVVRPDGGLVLIDGTRRPGDAVTRKSIGVAPQALSLYEELTAAENLRFFARLYDLSGSRLQERVDWALDFAGLVEQARRAVLETYEDDTLVEAIARELERSHGFTYIGDEKLTASMSVGLESDDTFLVDQSDEYRSVIVELERQG